MKISTVGIYLLFVLFSLSKVIALEKNFDLEHRVGAPTSNSLKVDGIASVPSANNPVPESAEETWIVDGMIPQATADSSRTVGLCHSLSQITAAAVVAACLASEYAALGQSELAWSFVPARPLRDLDFLADNVRQWVLTVYAEVSISHNKALADLYFQQAMGISHNNLHLLRVYSQYLLSQGQANEVVVLLNNRALDVPLQWLQCQALEYTADKIDYKNCRTDLLTIALQKNQSDEFIYPGLVDQIVSIGGAIVISDDVL